MHIIIELGFGVFFLILFFPLFMKQVLNELSNNSFYIPDFYWNQINMCPV